MHAFLIFKNNKLKKKMCMRLYHVQYIEFKRLLDRYRKGMCMINFLVTKKLRFYNKKIQET